MGQDQELEGEFSVGSAESDIFSLDSMYGTNIYIYICRPIDSPGTTPIDWYIWHTWSV